MLDYKNTYRRKVPLMQRVAMFVNEIIHGAD